MLMTHLISSAVLACAAHPAHLDKTIPQWAATSFRSNQFVATHAHTSDPQVDCKRVSIDGERLGNQPMFISVISQGQGFDPMPGYPLTFRRGVFTGYSSSNDEEKRANSLPLRFPIFSDHYCEKSLNGFTLENLAYWRRTSVTIADMTKRTKPRGGFQVIQRGRSQEFVILERIARHSIANILGEVDLINKGQAVVGSDTYTNYGLVDVPNRFRQAVPKQPTTRWIKLSDWARNHDVTVTYGDMTAEYVYRGKRYLLPLASDQFKKGTAWFKTSGPILMRGDDWLIPTAMVD